jgi:pyridine nucleotide-disulfide oxidoreductase
MSAADLAYAERTERVRATAVKAGAARRSCHVAVIGAGPYGLAVAAHLKAAGVETTIFGETLDFWRKHMPGRMRVRSPWRATHIADPDGELTLDAYARRVGMVPTEQLPIADFIRYGAWFQSRAAPDLDARKVECIEPAGDGFRLVLQDGEAIAARRVVVAMGLANQSVRPAQFNGLPAELVSHSADHVDFADFRGRTVTVLGRGQSAVESAVLLAEAGAEVALLSRGEVRWLGTGSAQTLRAVLASRSEVGPFPLDWLADAPNLLRLFPGALRRQVTTQCLRPAASGWLRPRAGGVRFVSGRMVAAAERQGSQIALRLDDGTSGLTDHVLLATGYRIDIARLGVLDGDLLGRIETIDGSPILSAGCESSVGGLHFVGSSAVTSLGPLMRFIAGAGPAARSVTRRVLASHS